MMAGWMLRGVLVLGLITISGCAVRSTVGAYMDEPAPPATADERRERCTTYANRLERTRAQMQRRNTFGRLDLLRAEQRSMERFVEAHCS
ncbi:MAG: hypothetical protein JJT88_05085 [Gammaproteobacteria bacterium]|nr:hypothetical protein [Gammaproteobacteria bacterium]